MSIHEAARAGFQAGADAYERGRPDYPRPAVARLLKELSSPETVVDLGAGTGKFTRLLREETRARIIAIEPVEAMREKLKSLQLPQVEALEGTAEGIPLPDASVDAVFVAQAFHWFDGPKTLRELHRILRPGGGIGLIWNRREESVPWLAELTKIIDPYEKGAPRYRSGEWRRAFDDRASGFTLLNHTEFPHSQLGPPEMVVDRLASISFIAALPSAEHERVKRQVRELMASAPETRGRERIEVPYMTDVFWCSRI